MTRLLAGRTLRLLLGLIALIEAHFVADSLASLMEVVVRNGGGVADTVLLLALNSPEVIDFALPLAVLIGLYFAIVSARDDNELVVCAAAGVSWMRVPGFALRVGLVGFVVSVIFAGFLTPTAKYGQRLAIERMELRSILAELTDPSPRNSLRVVKDRTVIATPSDEPDAERGNLFVFAPDTGAGWRVSQASDWTIDGPREDGGYAIRMQRFRDYRERLDEDAAEPAAGRGLAEELEFARIRVENVALEFRLEEIVEAVDRARRSNERLLFSLPALLDRAADRPLVDRRFGEVLARALLNLFAAAMAVAAAAVAGPATARLLALPAAVVVVLGADVGARTLLGDAAQAGPAAFWPAAAAAALIAVAAPFAYVAARREAIIAPRNGRA